MNKAEEKTRGSLRLDISACAKVASSLDVLVAERKYTEFDDIPDDERSNKRKRHPFFDSSTKLDGCEAPPTSPIAFRKDVK